MTSEGHSNITFLDDDGRRITINNHYEKEKAFTIAVPVENKKDEVKSPTGDYDPYVHRDVEHPISNTDTIIHLLKSSLGTGILAMPKAFHHAGYLVGSISTVIIGTVAVYCIHMLLSAHYELCKRKKVGSMDYPTIAESALLEGPKWIHKYAPYIVHVTNGFILTYQLGICCIYVVFVAENMKALVDYYTGEEYNVRLFMLIILLPLVLINWVRNLKYLAPFSTLANFITVVSFAIICYYMFREPLTLEGKRAAGTISEFPLFFGTVLFSLEAIGVIMPLENEMKSPKSFVGLTGVLNRAFAIIVFLYVGMGLFGYLKYGGEIKGSLTLNLPSEEILAQSVKGMLAFGIFITHGIACYVAIDLTWNNYIVSKITNEKHKLLWEYVVRTAIVLFTFLLAVAIPKLDLFISLFGALCLSALGLAFPALIETCIYYDQKSGAAKQFMIIKNVIIALFGVAGFIIGTYTSLSAIVGEFLK